MIDRPSSLTGQLMYTQRSQYGVSLKSDHWLKGLAGFFSVAGSVGEFPDQFYGVGGDVPASDEERFTARTYGVEAEANKAVGPGIRAGGPECEIASVMTGPPRREYSPCCDDRMPSRL